jgi:hypothetical protein
LGKRRSRAEDLIQSLDFVGVANHNTGTFRAPIGITTKWIAVSHAWERGGREEQRDGGQSKHKFFHGGSPLRKNSHRDKVHALVGISGLNKILVRFRKT